LEYVRRQLSVGVESTILYKSVQLTGYADDTDVRRTARVISEAYEKLKEKTKEVELNFIVKKKNNGRKQENKTKKKNLNIDS
jgi:hypothetical protein